MGVLKEIAGKNGSNIVLKIPTALHERIRKLKIKCKDAGCEVDINEAAIHSIERFVERAELELAGLAGRLQEKSAP